MYKTTFVVKYMQIDRELAAEYDGDMKDAVMDEVYRQELMEVLGASDVDDSALCDEMERMWGLAQHYPALLAAIRPDGKSVDELAFTMAFQYNTFWALHPCLCDIASNIEPSVEHLAALAEASKHTSLQYASGIIQEDDE
jgi:hypothetical protein